MESWVAKLTQGIEEIPMKVAKDAKSIKELQETNEVLLEKYQQNEKLLQRFLSRA